MWLHFSSGKMLMGYQLSRPVTRLWQVFRSGLPSIQSGVALAPDKVQVIVCPSLTGAPIARLFRRCLIQFMLTNRSLNAAKTCIGNLFWGKRRPLCGTLTNRHLGDFRPDNLVTLFLGNWKMFLSFLRSLLRVVTLAGCPCQTCRVVSPTACQVGLRIRRLWVRIPPVY